MRIIIISTILMGKTNDSRRPYILPVVSQDELIMRYGYYAAGLIGLFFCGRCFRQRDNQFAPVNLNVTDSETV